MCFLLFKYYYADKLMETKQGPLQNRRNYKKQRTRRKKREKNGSADRNKDNLKQFTATQGWILLPNKIKCATTGSCKAIIRMPLATHCRCVVCAYCSLHGVCSMEPTAT